MCIVAIDIETTGLSREKCGIVQLSMIKFERATMKILDTFDTYLKPRADAEWIESAVFITGITKEMVANAPTLEEKADEIIDFIGDNDILTYNGNTFDIPFIQAEFQRIGRIISMIGRKVYDSYYIESQIHSRKLGAVYESYYGETMEDAGLTAHNSFSDIQATIAVFKKQAEIADVDSISDKFVSGGAIGITDGVRVFMIGKYTGVPITEVIKKDPGWVSWLIKTKKDVDLFTIIKEEYQKVHKN